MANKFSRKDFLDALFGEYESSRDGFIRVITIRHLDRRISTRYFPKLETLAKEQYQDNQHVFFGVCPHENMKPEKSNIHFMVALWAGLDLAPNGYSGKDSYFSEMSYAAKAVRSFPLPPSIVIESGWGVHLYWLLKRITPIEDVSEVERLLTTINEYFQCKKPIGIDSTLRLPDTFNSKVPSNVVKCGIKYLNPEFRYDLEEFDKLRLASYAPSADSALIEAQADEMSDAAETGPSEQEWPGAGQALHAEQVEEYLGKDLSESEVASSQLPSTPPPPPGPEIVSRIDHALSTKETASRDVEASCTEPDEEVEAVEVLEVESTDSIANEIVDKVVDRLTGELMEKLVDEIVEKLYRRIMDTSGPR